jgi:hypothetical protein
MAEYDGGVESIWTRGTGVEGILGFYACAWRAGVWSPLPGEEAEPDIGGEGLRAVGEGAAWRRGEGGGRKTRIASSLWVRAGGDYRGDRAGVWEARGRFREEAARTSKRSPGNGHVCGANPWRVQACRDRESPWSGEILVGQFCLLDDEATG